MTRFLVESLFLDENKSKNNSTLHNQLEFRKNLSVKVAAVYNCVSSEVNYAASLNSLFKFRPTFHAEYVV